VQHASYLRGTFEIDESGVYLLDFHGLNSFNVDGVSYPGNLYSYDHATDSAVWLNRGKHTIYVCLVNDIRINGGGIPPRNSFSGTITKVDTQLSDSVVTFPNDTILPELQEGTLISKFASVAIKNAKKIPFSPPRRIASAPGWKQVLKIIVSDSDGIIPAAISTRFTIYIAPGQIVAVPFRIERSSVKPDIKILVRVLDLDSEATHDVFIGDFKLYERKASEGLYKFTFIGFDYAIQYAYAKPPLQKCTAYSGNKCPVVVALHGTKFFVSDSTWLSAVSRQDFAWVGSFYIGIVSFWKDKVGLRLARSCLQKH
jgi:hypothetical protein